MGKRRAGREAALQLLYQLEAAGRFDEAETAIGEHFQHIAPETDDEVKRFAKALCQGVAGRLQTIDRLVDDASDNWRIDRMSQVDRNILRIASYELLSDPEMPPKAVINEAIELGKAFGTAESGRFINGVLDRLLKALPRSPGG